MKDILNAAVAIAFGATTFGLNVLFDTLCLMNRHDPGVDGGLAVIIFFLMLLSLVCFMGACAGTVLNIMEPDAERWPGSKFGGDA
jgi:hypothetical protein